ncbi:MAG: four-carbon acid sugar kinase family protein, partial [Clostridiales bacterium]|nr:four-carbon acid sugar kinase family protein [Clostridiales bacterium]
MITLLIIADDFTGALDTGVQFAAAGTVVRVVTDIRYDYRKADEGVRVLV